MQFKNSRILRNKGIHDQMFFSHGRTWTYMDKYFLHARLGMKKILHALGMVIYYKVAAI